MFNEKIKSLISYDLQSYILDLNCSCKGGTTNYKEMKLWQSGRRLKERCLFTFIVT